MNVEYFMKQLAEQTTPMNKNVDFKAKNRSLEKISLSFEGNFGRYQIFPFESVVQDIPFITLYDTKEICIPRMGKAADGSPNPYKTWIKLLPIEGYKMKDSTGRIVSSLTADEEDMLRSARTLFDQVYEELDVKNNLQYMKDVARKRNYTIFHAYCINKWESGGDSRQPIRSNFSGLFVCTAKGFMGAVEESISSKSLLTGGDQKFIEEIYNRNLTGRTGFVLFTIGKSKVSAGYQVNVQHECNISGISNITVPQEDADLMKDPVASFLGWQAAKEDENVPVEQRRLFNRVIIQEAINYMTKQLAAIRAAKQNNSDVNEAMRVTNDLVLKDLQNQPQTNDPMLQAQDAVNTPDPDFIRQQNTQPFQTPPASKMSPITGAPEETVSSGNSFGNSNNGFGGFGGNSAPSFTSPFGNFSNGNSGTNDLPF